MGNLSFAMKKKEYCEFCDIITNNKELLIYEDDEIIAFHDIDKASAVEHVLVCPKAHIPNIDSLSFKDIALVKNLHSIGEQLLHKLRPNCTYRFGYHSPPFNSIDHLHMHAFVLPLKDKAKNLIIYGYMLTPPEKIIKKLAYNQKIKE